MNHLEKNMVQVLRELKDQYHVRGVKAEFEAEGTRLEEAHRLKDIALRAGMDLSLKIGGCEAIRDMRDAILLGAECVIAPMVESPFALTKFLKAISAVYPEEDHEATRFLINLETKTAFHNFQNMLDLPEIDQLDGIVIGRVDLTASLGKGRNEVNSRPIQDLALQAAGLAKEKGLEVVVGGGVTYQSLQFFQAFPIGHLDRFETRKIIFSCPEALTNPERAFDLAIQFELLWLRNKKRHYRRISKEDDDRLDMLKNRLQAQGAKIQSAAPFLPTCI